MKQNRMTVLVVFADKNRANWYMENCFEYYTRVLVTSMDGIFPKHPELKTDVKKLWRDNNANLIVFGTHCIEDNPPASIGYFSAPDICAVLFDNSDLCFSNHSAQY